MRSNEPKRHITPIKMAVAQKARALSSPAKWINLSIDSVIVI